MVEIKSLRVELDESKSNKEVKVYKFKDLELAAFLLIQDGFELVDVERKVGHHNHVVCLYFIANNTDRPIKNWILDYQNDKILSPIHKYLAKLNDLRNFIKTSIN